MELAGIGIYTFQEAGRFTKAEPREIRRWLQGYRFKSSGEQYYSPPLWKPQVDHPGAIGFHDLLELRFVKEFVRRGVHLSVVRSAIANARQLFRTDYPLTTHRFLTDGKRVFHEALEAEGELTDIAARQIVFESIIRPSLYAGIEYKKDGSAKRWFPLARTKAIVLDPGIGFGAPILAEFGIPVDTVVAAVAAEKSINRVAHLFNIPRAAVTLAVKYENRFAA